MPVTRNPAGASAAVRSRSFLFLRLLGVTLAALFALFCVLLLLLRYVVMPQLPNHRQQLAGMLSSRIGAPVTIDSLQTGWDGWNPKLVVDGFRVGQPGGLSGVSVLELPHVELVASWISLPLLQLRLKALLVERPRLAITRDPGGRIHVAGLEIDPANAGDDSAFTEWLLRQREIVVRDALITWNDEHRNAPQLVLDRVQFRLENELLHHRFGLTGVPPAELASPIDFRGDITGVSLSDWQRATGNLYLRLDYADVAAWGEWIPMPVHTDSGKGALRMWFNFGNGVARSVTSDIELADVSLQAEPGLPSLKLLHLAGRMEWREDVAQRTVTGRSIAFTTREGSTQPPTDFTWMASRGPDGATTGGRFTFSRVELATLASVAEQLPLPADWRKLLSERTPHGALANGDYHWQGSLDAPQQWQARSDLVEVGFRGDRTWPGATNISGSLDTANDHGSLRLVSRMVTFDAPRVLHEPLAFDALDGALAWKRTPDGLQLDVTNLAFANADVAGSVSGTWRELADTPGEVNLTATLARVNVPRLGLYLGAAFGDPARDWFTEHFTKGTLTEGRIAWAGNVAEFPSSSNHHGMFTLEAKLADVAFTPGTQWPGFTDLDGSLQVDRTHIAADIAHGHILDATINHATVDIPDVVTPSVGVNLDVGGPVASFLAFVAQSPVAGWIDHNLDDGKGTGDGTLTAQFRLPLATHEAATFSGLFTFGGNDLTLPGAPALGAVTGTLRFNEHGIVSGNLAGNAFGGPTTIDIAGGDGKVRVNASGVANLDTLHRTYPLPLVDRVGGHTDWQFGADIRQGEATWTIDAPMKGATINLPAPLGKTADSAMPVRIERHQVAVKGDHDILMLDVRNTVRLTINRHFAANGDAVIDRALALVGKAVEKPGDSERTGAWIRAVLPKVDLDEWWAVRAGEPAGDNRPAMAIRLMGIDIAAAQATAMERIFHGIEISARSNQENWDLDLAGTDFEGTAQWQAPTPALPNGRLVARLARLRIPQSPEALPVAEVAAPALAAERAARWPEIDVDATHFISGAHEIGRLQLRAQPSGSDWLIKELNITNDGGTLAATGRWHIDDRSQQTDVKAKLDTKDAGAFLLRFGYPEAIRGAPTQIEGTLSWAGAPSEFDYPTLSGTLQLHTGPGQFTKIDPGLGKLLGVLSLQALPRRIELDFRDVFSEGFAFDEATGTVHIAKGVVRTDDFTILGPAARVTIRGEADLAQETQQLMVRIQPSLATSFSAGTAGAAMLLLAANPVVAAVVGAGTLLAQKVLQDPIEAIFSYEYQVTGSWTDPVVARVDGRKVTPDATPRAPPEAASGPADAATKPADSKPKGPADPASKAAGETPSMPAAETPPAPGAGTPANSPAS